MVAVCLPLIAVLGACGGSGDDAGSTTTAPSRTTSSATTGSTTTTTAPATSTTQGSRERWIGVTWEPGADEPDRPTVGGTSVGLTSVVGMCQRVDCAYGLDLLAAAEVSGQPPPGPYLLWSSRSVDHRADGRPIWQIVDVADVTLEPGTGPILCSPEGDPATQVLGVASTSLPESGTVVPDQVWTVDAEGAITTPDPAGYTCEVGQD